MRQSCGYWLMGLALLLGSGTPFADSAYSQEYSVPVETNPGGIEGAGAVNPGLGNAGANLNLNPGAGLNPSLGNIPGAPNLNSGGSSSSGSGEPASWTADELAQWLESSRPSVLTSLPILEKVHRVIEP